MNIVQHKELWTMQSSLSESSSSLPLQKFISLDYNFSIFLKCDYGKRQQTNTIIVIVHGYCGRFCKQAVSLIIRYTISSNVVFH